MIYHEALEIAEKYRDLLAPHCERIEIAGSIRRLKREVKDIEIVCIPKPYETGLFESGFAEVVNQWPIVRGILPCKATQRKLPEGIALDIFTATPDNFGWIYLLRTGSADFNAFYFLPKLKENGYVMLNGNIYLRGTLISIPDEADLFRRVSLTFIEPQMRTIEIYKP